MKLSENAALTNMKDINDFIKGSKMSQNLYRNLNHKQKESLRGLVKKKAHKLVKDETIVSIKTEELKPL